MSDQKSDMRLIPRVGGTNPSAGVTNVTATAPITSSGGPTPNIGINLSTDFDVVGGNLVLAADRFGVGANDSLTTSATQWIQPGSGLVTSTANIAPAIAIRNGTLTTYALRFDGDAANVAGQTVQFFCRLDGTPFLLVAGLATTAGAKFSTGLLAVPQPFVIGSRIEIALEPSAVLSAALHLICVSLG